MAVAIKCTVPLVNIERPLSVVISSALYGDGYHVDRTVYSDGFTHACA
jgi:hypothetical protein